MKISTFIVSTGLAMSALAMPALSGLAPAAAQSGLASWYALHSRTACGEKMNPAAMTAAHRTLPCGTRIKVTHKSTGRSVIVRVNDRGPFKRGRVVDLSRGAARHIGMIHSGVAPVSLQVVGKEHVAAR
jgi:rare lipoprotein A